MIKIWFLLFFFKKIYSISGTDGEAFPSGYNTEPIVNLYEICPCDKTAGVCDSGCYCDKDCIQYMMDNDYYKQYPDSDPSSYASRNLNSKLDYCYEYKKSLDDLYNPLVLAFKILKRGFCLYKDNSNNDDNDNDNDNNDSEQNDSNDSNIFAEVIGNDRNNAFIQFRKMNIMAPTALPSGLCLLNSYPIKYYEDYEVICSYRIDSTDRTIISNAIAYQFAQGTPIYNLINGNKYYYTIEKNLNTNNYLIKKIERIYYVKNNSYDTFLYYEDIDRDNTKLYQDLTIIVKFLEDTDDYTRSGNPGYIKGKPILVGLEGSNRTQYKNDATFPMYYRNSDYSNYNQQIHYFYYNNYFDNKITFEDFMIYGYNERLHAIMNNLFNISHNIIGKYGNANVNYDQDWNKISSEYGYDYIYLLTAEYRYVGAVNNPQIKITKFTVHRNNYNNGNSQDNNLCYFIAKFFKQNNIKTKWWYAPGPGFFKLPRNVMYPFRIGTTQYTTS